MRRLELNLLKTFVAVAELGSFTAAGRVLGRTQSAISLQVKRLEDYTECTLLNRTSRSIELTSKGAVLLLYARQMLKLNDEALHHLGDPPGHERLRLGTTEHFVENHVPALLASVAKLCPSIRLDVRIGRTGGLLRALAHGELDLVIAKREQPTASATVLRRDALHWVAGRGVDIDRDPLPMIFLNPPCTLRDRAIAALENSGRRWRLANVTETFGGVRAALKAGLGIAVMESGLVPEQMRMLGPAEGFPDLGFSEFAMFGEERLDPSLAWRVVPSIMMSLAIRGEAGGLQDDSGDRGEYRTAIKRESSEASARPH